jgi:hypothetical protein
MCIRIYNNWDLEKDAFNQAMPLRQSYEIIVEPNPIVLPESLCPELFCNTTLKEVIQEQTINDCPDCLQSVSTSIQLIKIPEELITEINQDTLLYWWIINNEKVFDNKNIKNFIFTLNNSQIFNVLLKKKGIIKTVRNASEFYKDTNITISLNDNFIELRLNVLINGRNENDLDNIYIQNKDKINKSIELEAIAFY